MQIDPQRADSFGIYASLGRLVAQQSVAFPRHIPFFTRRFSVSDPMQLQLCDHIAAQILCLAGDELDSFVEGYDFICDKQVREEIHFRRHKTYRLKTHAEAMREVYGDAAYMQKYMRGLLLTQVFWSNHTAAMAFYMRTFLHGLPERYSLLEVGPGHGLLLSRAAASPRARRVVGWDVSPASIAETRDALSRLGVEGPHTLEVQDLLSPCCIDMPFDAVVLSEVLEHLETPGVALDAVHALLQPHGRVYINLPVNCPAPDHLFLLRSPEEAITFVESHGFDIEVAEFYPATNYSLDEARKLAVTISVCIVARMRAGEPQASR